MNKSRILFFVGAPGVGKTTLVRSFMDYMDGEEDTPPKRELIAKPKWTIAKDVYCAAGHYTGSMFDGADTVGYNQATVTLDYWFDRLSLTPITIFDGDRFSNKGSWEKFAPLAFVRNVVWVTAPDEVAAARRAGRGSNQNETWIKGRVTKAANFAALDPKCLVIDGSLGPTDMLGSLLLLLS